MKPAPEGSEYALSFLSRLSDATASVLTQATGTEVGASGAPRPASSKDDPGGGDCRLVFTAEGSLRGALSLALDTKDAMVLARSFTGVPVEDAVEFMADDREALEELWRQVMGQFAALLRPEIGELRWVLGPQGEGQLEPATSATLEFVRAGQPLRITAELDRELVESLALADPPAASPGAAAAAPPEPPQPASPVASNLRAENLELLLNVELPATIRFGQKQMRLQEIMQLTAGAVIDLDREVQEPVELLVDGRVIARGEAVIVDGNFGLRITELASPSARLAISRGVQPMKLLPWWPPTSGSGPLFLPTCASPECRERRPLLGLWWRDQGIAAHGQWYCSAACCRAALARSVEELLTAGRQRRPAVSRMPLGLLLVSQGRLRADQVSTALERQREAGEGKIGTWLRRSGAITPEELTRALGQQSNCPVLALDRVVLLPDRVPYYLRRRQRVLPVYWSAARNTLWIAFASPVRHAVLRAIEQILECRCDPCMVDEAALAQALEGPAGPSAQHETVFRAAGAAEIASIAVSYANQLQARQLRWTECDGDIWVRFSAGDRVSDVFFEPGVTALAAALTGC